MTWRRLWAEPEDINASEDKHEISSNSHNIERDIRCMAGKALFKVDKTTLIKQNLECHGVLVSTPTNLTLVISGQRSSSFLEVRGRFLKLISV